MNTTVVKISSLWLISGALILAGCTSSDDSAPASGVPAGAVTITASNAKASITTAVATANLALSALGAQVVQPPSAMDIVNLVNDLRKNSTSTSVLSTPTGIIDITPCDTGDITNSFTATDTSASGTFTFNSCTFVGVTLNGALSYNSTFPFPSGPGAYSDHVSGTVTATISTSSGPFVTTIGGLNFTDSGTLNASDIATSYTINPFSYSIDFTGGNGYAVSLLAPVTGDDTFDSVCPTAGTILVTGASSTKAKATIVYPNVNIELDDGSGTYVLLETAPCTDIFQ
jgi:hypothetical protein